MLHIATLAASWAQPVTWILCTRVVIRIRPYQHTLVMGYVQVAYAPQRDDEKPDFLATTPSNESRPDPEQSPAWYWTTDFPVMSRGCFSGAELYFPCLCARSSDVRTSRRTNTMDHLL